MFSLDDRSPAEGRNGWPMPRLPSDPDRDFSASQSEDDIHAEIVELFVEPADESRSAHSTGNGRTDETAAPRQVIAPVPVPQNGLASPAGRPHSPVC
jgi:hypothetical protein